MGPQAAQTLVPQDPCSPLCSPVMVMFHLFRHCGPVLAMLHLYRHCSPVLAMFHLYRHRTRAFVLSSVPAQSISSTQLFATPWTVACQAPLSTGFLRQEYWSSLLFPSPGDLPNPGIEPMSLTSPALAGGFFAPTSPGKPFVLRTTVK